MSVVIDELLLASAPSAAVDDPTKYVNYDVTSDTFDVATTSSTPTAATAYPPWAEVLIIIVCSVIVVGTVVGNVLVCMAVSIVRKLRTPSNWLIVSLAVSDLLVALLVMPLAVVYEIKREWVFSAALCDGWTSLDVLLCTASILNLCMISVDRYLVITRPFQYAVKRTPARMAAMILSVWIASALISIPPLFGFKEDMERGECRLSQKIGYQLYATFGAFYVPLLIMIVIYARIFAVSKRIAKAEARSKPSTVQQNHGSSGGSSLRPSSSKRAEDRRRTSEHLLPVTSKASLEVGGTGSRRQSSTDWNNHHSGGLRKNLSFLHRQAHRLPSAAKDTKATKTLGVIMGAFTVCWLPFFILALIKPFCWNTRCIPDELSSVFLWLGFANSFLNPIIYARFNRDFRRPFIEILLCRCRMIDSRLRSESYVEQFGAAANTSGGGSSAAAFQSHHHPLQRTKAATAGHTSSAICKMPSFVLTSVPDDVENRQSDVTAGGDNNGRVSNSDHHVAATTGSISKQQWYAVTSPLTLPVVDDDAAEPPAMTVGVSVHNGIACNN